MLQDRKPFMNTLYMSPLEGDDGEPTHMAAVLQTRPLSEMHMKLMTPPAAAELARSPPAV